MAIQSTRQKTMKIYIINLEKSTDRLTHQIKQFDRLGLNFERLNAVSIQDITEEFYLSHLKYGQRLIKQGEMACFLSHKKAWELVVLHNEPCVILEDDALLVHDFADLLKAIEEMDLSHQVDLINLEVQPRSKIVSHKPIRSFLNQEYYLYELFLEKNGTGGYIIFPSGAKKLLAYAKTTLGLADAFIYSCPNLKTTQIEPAVLLQDVICPAYNIPIEQPPKSIILNSQNTLQFQPNLYHKILFRKNRILTQLKLGIKTLISLSKGKNRQIAVNQNKFLTQKTKQKK